VRFVAEEAAALKELDVEQLAAITADNARRLFRL
jgi:Tat protein secretion system quality control protein TatD with DNase activity